MTWAKVSDTFNDDARLLALDRSTRLLHVEAVVYACRVLSDGAIPRSAFGRFTDHDDPPAAAAQLVDAGLWQATDTGWQIVNFDEDQDSREQVEMRQRKNKLRQRNFRRHKDGDHGEHCPKTCKDGNAVTNTVTNRATNSVRNTTPTRPDPTRREGTSGSAPQSAVRTCPIHLTQVNAGGVCSGCRSDALERQPEAVSA